MVAVPKLTALGKESSGISSHSKGVVAVPRDMPKVLSLPGFDVGNFQNSEHRHPLADIYLGGSTLNFEQQKEVWKCIYTQTQAITNKLLY